MYCIKRPDGTRVSAEEFKTRQDAKAFAKKEKGEKDHWVVSRSENHPCGESFPDPNGFRAPRDKNKRNNVPELKDILPAG